MLRRDLRRPRLQAVGAGRPGGRGRDLGGRAEGAAGGRDHDDPGLRQEPPLRPARAARGRGADPLVGDPGDGDRAGGRADRRLALRDLLHLLRVLDPGRRRPCSRCGPATTASPRWCWTPSTSSAGRCWWARPPLVATIAESLEHSDTPPGRAVPGRRPRAARGRPGPARTPTGRRGACGRRSTRAGRRGDPHGLVRGRRAGARAARGLPPPRPAGAPGAHDGRAALARGAGRPGPRPAAVRAAAAGAGGRGVPGQARLRRRGRVAHRPRGRAGGRRRGPGDQAGGPRPDNPPQPPGGGGGVGLHLPQAAHDARGRRARAGAAWRSSTRPAARCSRSARIPA